MNKSEAERLAIYCNKLWPSQVTAELGELMRKNFRDFDAKVAREAIEKHRTEANTDGFLNLGRLLDAMRIAEKSVDMQTRSVPTMSYADMQRQISPCFVELKYNDPQVILCVQRRLWRMALGRNPLAFAEKQTEATKQHASCLAAHRSHIDNECTMLLMGAGMDRETAPKWTAAIFDDDVNFFRQTIEALDGWAAPGTPDAQEAVAFNA